MAHAHFASHSSGPPAPSRRTTFAAAANDVLEVAVLRHEVVLGRDLRGVSEPLGDHVGRVPLRPVGRTGRPEDLQDPLPGLVARLEDDPLEVRPIFTRRRHLVDRRPARRPRSPATQARRHPMDRSRDQELLSARGPARRAARPGRPERPARGRHCERQDRVAPPVGFRSVPLGGSGGRLHAAGGWWRERAAGAAGRVRRPRKCRGEQARMEACSPRVRTFKPTCQAVRLRRRSSSPRAPVTRARTPPRPAGSISGTAEGAYSTT